MLRKTQVARLLGIRPGTFKTNIINDHYRPIIGEIARGPDGQRGFTESQVRELRRWYSDSHVKLRCISLGGGVQSTTIVLMHLLERAFDPPPDMAIFIDLGWERKATYENIAKLTEEGRKQGFRVETVTRRNIRDDILKNVGDRTSRVPTPPMFFMSEAGKKAQIARECTANYKIDVMNEELRKNIGIPPGMQIRYRAETWIGISTDEAQRMNSGNNPKWVTVRYPLIEAGMSRNDCGAWLKAHGWEIPVKSSCLGCPFKPNREWADMKYNRAEEWADVIQIDRAVRGGVNNVTSKTFLHQSLRPLEEIEFRDPGREDKYDECGGYCHT